MNETCMTTREWLHHMIDLIEDEGDLDALKWLTQRCAARSLNRRWRQATNEANACVGRSVVSTQPCAEG